MKTEIIFWLNTKTGVIYHKTYHDTIFREVGEENQFGHVIIAISIIKNKKLKCCNSGLELLKVYSEKEETKKDKIINKIISRLEKMKG